MAAIELIDTPLYDDPDLVAYYRFEDNSNDSIGSNNGTDTSITYSTGKFGKGAVFDGTNSHIALTPFAWDGTNMSAVAWVNTDGTVADRGTIVYAQNGASTPFWEMAIDTSAGVRVHYQDNTAGRIVGDTAINGAWHHVAFTKSGSAIKVYVDGVEENSGTGNSGNNNASVSQSRIGANYEAGNKYKGTIDEVALFARALTAEEISNLYNGTFPTETNNALFFAGD